MNKMIASGEEAKQIVHERKINSQDRPINKIVILNSNDKKD